MAQDLVEQHLEERSMLPDDRSPGFAGALGVFSVRRCIMMYLACRQCLAGSSRTWPCKGHWWLVWKAGSFFLHQNWCTQLSQACFSCPLSLSVSNCNYTNKSQCLEFWVGSALSRFQTDWDAVAILVLEETPLLVRTWWETAKVVTPVV